MNAEGKSRAKAYTYAGGSIRGIANTARPPDHASLRAARPLCFFFASASHELTGICVHLRLIGIGKNSGQSRACRDGQRAPEDPGGIRAEREDRGSTPPDGARSGQGSPARSASFFRFSQLCADHSLDCESFTENRYS